MDNFQSLNLHETLTKALTKMNFDTPTPVQAEAIPPALQGKDILASAQTGTGKTAAFGIPLVSKLLASPRGSALVMTPTRELAVQVQQQLVMLLGDSRIKSALLIGGDSMPKQLQQLRMRPRVIVGTPGRINDHLERGSLMLHDTQFLVLDETDRMLDMGFSIQIDRIVKFIAKEHQTLLFSATLPKNIVNMSRKYQRDPVRITIGTNSAPAQNIEQETLHVSDGDKYPQLLTQLNQREGSVIIFVKTKRGADKLAMRLRKDKHGAEAIHGDLRQSKRDRVILNFRNAKHRILVATDIAARGLDIPHIEHVINYDLPQCPEDYIHRIGRTARAGAKGSAICFISPADKLKWRDIERLLDPNAKQSGGDDRKGSGPRRRPGGGRPGGGNSGGGNSSGGRNNRSFGGKKPGGANGGGDNKRPHRGKPSNSHRSDTKIAA